MQFDTAIPANGQAAGAVTCRSCNRTITSAYYDVNGQTLCVGCSGRVQAMTETPRGAAPMLKAGLFGLGGGIAGAIIYYAVIAITNFEIGIVAILIGYMVGYCVRKGAGGHGGRRFQVLAGALTYAGGALGYSPIAGKGGLEGRPPPPAAAETGQPGPQPAG